MSGISRVSGARAAGDVAAAAAVEAHAATPAAAAVLNVGSKGPAVKALQEDLTAAGFKTTADGIYGRGTASSVAAFQKSKGLPTTGAADAATLAALKKATAGGKIDSFTLGGKPNGTGAEWGPKDLVVKVGGKSVKLADDAILAKSFGDGRYIAWTSPKGSGGFENEGQGLMVYDAKTGKTKQVMSEYFMAEDIVPAKLADGRFALLVPMTDGGLGLDRLAVVDPTRGETAYISGAKLAGKPDAAGKVTINKLKVVEGEIKPNGKQVLDLNKLVDGKVIVNKRDPM
jgi:peptidoglycan hydrolase-like protein with peptidoglycan-binding domain